MYAINASAKGRPFQVWRHGIFVRDWDNVTFLFHQLINACSPSSFTHCAEAIANGTLCRIGARWLADDVKTSRGGSVHTLRGMSFHPMTMRAVCDVTIVLSPFYS